MIRILMTVGGVLLALVQLAGAYPLDGFEHTKIYRLQAYDKASAPLLQQGRLKPGSMLRLNQVKLSLADDVDFTLPPVDKDFTAEIRSYMGPDAASYGLAVLDITDLSNPRYAELNARKDQQPGSIGKISIAVAMFQALADVYPDDVTAREAVLRNTIVKANEFIIKDSHKVPFWRPGDPTVATRPIELGDEDNLWTYLDWMCSASSNAAASMVMSQAMLLKHFGKEYPVSEERAAAYFSDTSKEELTASFRELAVAPLTRAGIGAGEYRQGSFFTRTGKNKVPSLGSTASARGLMKYLIAMEEGRLVDSWSSLEIKRLIYLTDTRIRYASNPILKDSAVYFKSGSLYGCKDEPGFTCGKFMGNRINYMNSILIVEGVGPDEGLRYIVTLLSNVLRKNSAVVHQEMGGNIHELIRASHPNRGQGLGAPGKPTLTAP